MNTLKKQLDYLFGFAFLGLDISINSHANGASRQQVSSSLVKKIGEPTKLSANELKDHLSLNHSGLIDDLTPTPGVIDEQIELIPGFRTNPGKALITSLGKFEKLDIFGNGYFHFDEWLTGKLGDVNLKLNLIKDEIYAVDCRINANA